ncbi:MAG: hypothetical protein IPN42_03080 [Methylococcaceae bacterium]|nr:hypothetical protein [Methylococcaceae bacterium]
MDQKPITVVVDILEDRVNDLKDYLGKIGIDIKKSQDIQFSTLKTLHYCCFIIIEDDQPPPGGAKAAPVLVFEANIDGKQKDFIADLIKQYPAFVHQVYSCCAGYSADGQKPADDRLAAFLLANDRGANAFYIGYPGQSRDILEYQVNLRSTIESYIDANRDTLIKLPPAEIKKNIIGHVSSTVPNYANTKPVKPSLLVSIGRKLAPYVPWVIAAVLLSVLVIAFFLLDDIGVMLILGSIAAFVVVLLCHEIADKQDGRVQWDHTYLRDLQDIENRQPQNHLSSIIYVKPGKFRLFTLKFVLAFIAVVAKLFATEGNLSGIVTIHFARWVILPGKQPNERTRLLFFSNYDGSWENYLGEFIDHAAVGLTAVWSNTESNERAYGRPAGFPNTRLLGAVFDENKKWTSIFPAGARDEQRFKTFARNSQRPESIWYCAYPDLSIKNVGNNLKIHEGLFGDTDVSAWLNRL